MVFLIHLKAMLKLEYILMKRNIFLSFLEIFSPIILLLFFFFLRLLFSQEKEEYNSLYKDDIEYIFTHSTNLTNNISSDYNLENIEKNENAFIPYLYFLKQCKLNKHIALIGKNFPEEIKIKIKEYFWEFDDEPDINENKVFKIFENVNEFNKYISQENYGTNNDNPEICFGISMTDQFQFGIHYKGLSDDTSNEIEELLSKETPHIPNMKSDKNEKIRTQEKLKFFESYKDSGYLMVLKIIYDYFLQKITGDLNAEIEFTVIGMKFDSILSDSFHKFLSLLSFFIIISYAIPMSINIYRQIHLIETQKKEYLKIMGLSEKIFFITNFIKSFIINIFHTIFNALIVYGILRQSQYGYLFIIFFFFGLVIFSMTYFFQSFLKISRLGVIISLLIFCIMSFFYLPMKSPVVSNSLRYFFCILFPPMNILLGFNSLYIFEKEFAPLDNRVGLDVDVMNIQLMIVFLLVSFFLYIFLGFLFSNVFCYGNGVKYKNENKSINDVDLSDENTASIFDMSDKDTNISQKSKTKNSYEKSSDNSSKTNKKYNNPPKKEKNNNIDDFKLGEKYMESVNESNNNNNKNKEDNDNNLSDIKLQYNDYIDSKAKNQAYDIQQKRLENLKKSLWKLNKNKKDKIGEINLDDPFHRKEDDNIEYDLENQIEKKRIKNLRRTLRCTMYQLRPEEEDIDDIQNINNIEYSLEESVKNSLKDMVNLIGEKSDKGSNNEFNIDINNNNIINIDNDFSLNEKKEEKEEKEIKKEIIEEEKKPDKSSKKKDKEKEKKKKEKKRDINYYEKKRENDNIGVKIIVSKLTKIYEDEKDNHKKNIVLNELSIKFRKSEIFALLGQNGEGKSTFISILSGLKEATSGNIIYINKFEKEIEVLSPSGIRLIRNVLGVCYQNNVLLYEDLTVAENLEIFSNFKSSPENEGVQKILEKYGLLESKDKKAGKISGGEKRKLLIAISFLGENEIIILDEPTGGVDMKTKMEIWDILKERKTNKVIILITHEMEEAQEIADRIGILKNGELIFKGSKEHLSQNYGKFFHIQINKKIDKKLRGLPGIIENKFLIKKANEKSKSGNTKNIISETGSNSGNLISDTNTESFTSNMTVNLDKVEFHEYKERAVIKIPKKLFNSNKLNELLQLIEEEYDVKNYYINAESLDDLFINAVGGKKDNDKKKYLYFSEEDNYITDSASKFKNELNIMLFKRFFETIRDKKSIILEILFPIVLTLISCLLCYFEILENNKAIPLDLYNMDQNTQSIFYCASNGSNYEEFGNVLSSEIKEEHKKLPNYNFQYIPNVLEEEGDSKLKSIINYYNVLYEYSKRENIKNNTGGFYFMKADKYLHKYEFNFYISSKKKHSTIFLTNYLLRTIARYELKRSSTYKQYMNNIQITNSPFPLTYKEKDDKKSRNGFSLVFFISIALSLIPANFITIIVREKENKSKHLQKLSGVSICVYWLNNYIFELVKYYLVVGLCLVILFCFNFYEKYLVLLYIFYGPALISFTYVLSYFLKKEGNAQITILLINLFFGSLCGSAVLILRTNKNLKYFGMILSFFFRLIPSFCICYGYNQLISKKILYAIDYFKLGDDIDVDKIKKDYYDSTFMITDPNYISSDLIFLSLEILIYTLLLIFLEKKEYFLWKFGLKKIDLNISYNNTSIKGSIESKVSKRGKKDKKKSKDAKNSGRTSKTKISQPIEEGKEYALEVNKLTKSFLKKDKGYINFLNYLKYKCCFCKQRPNETILNEISFKVSNNECYCLLGRNGSGKTTSFQCLSKEMEFDKGSIQVNGINIKDFTKEQPIIGYCPQFDCIFEYLTTKENLYFYAKLNNYQEHSINIIITVLLEKLDLKKYEDKIVQNLSGGNKRKLSVGISLLCKPTVILMDEPSTGMDPYSRLLLLDLIHNAYLKKSKNRDNRKKRALVLITHLINEAQLISDKIGFLNNKKIIKRGKINELIREETKFIILSVEFFIPSEKSVKQQFGDILSKSAKSSNDINNLLSKINRENYQNYLTKEKFGRDIYKAISKKGSAKYLGILRIIKYLDYLFTLCSKIKDYFSSVNCIHYCLNNYIFKIYLDDDKEKCPSRIFGIIEGCKKDCKISEYVYEITNLEDIFLKYTRKDDENYTVNSIYQSNKLSVNIPLELKEKK